MSRIELTDTLIDSMVKMSEGNPGAISAMMEIIAEHNAKVIGGLSQNIVNEIRRAEPNDTEGFDAHTVWRISEIVETFLANEIFDLRQDKESS